MGLYVQQQHDESVLTVGGIEAEVGCGPQVDQVVPAG